MVASILRRTIITILLVLVAMTGQAQTKNTAIVKGYSPALEDSTVVNIYIDNMSAASDTVFGGRFTLTVPVEKLTESRLFLMGKGCPNYLSTLFLSPGVTVSLTGTDCLHPLWKVDSPVPEQQTINRIMEHNSEAIREYLLIELDDASWNKMLPIYMKMLKQTLDILPSLPVDAASLTKLEGVAHTAKNMKDFPYMQQLKELEASTAARAPKGFEKELAMIHAFVYPSHVQQVGEEFVDAELFDMQGNTHRLSEAFADGRHVLLDFWSLGCGPCRMAEPEMREVYERMKDRLEIIGINRDNPSTWQENDWSKKIVWPNWNDGKMGKGGVENLYCDEDAIPYYVLLSPDGRILWKNVGYGVGWFLGMAEAISGPKQDNSANLQLAVRHIDVNSDGTTVSFRYYGKKGYWFRVVSDSYLTANGKKYKVTTADGIKLEENNYPQVKASSATEGIMEDMYYSNFTLTFEPFDTIPETFDFKEGDGQGAFVIRNISLK
jgi:thiol-disulfide isomerase/thioredoxin